MTPEIAVDLFREALWLTSLIVAVCVVPSLIVGLMVAVFQAATQINEQTLSFLPRLLVMLITLVVLEVLAESFVTLPVGEGLLLDHYWSIAGKLSWVVAAGLLISLPIVTALLVVNLAFGVMTRAAPQLNIFSIGFPLTLVLGLFIFWVGLADFLAHFQEFSADALQQLRELARLR